MTTEQKEQFWKTKTLQEMSREEWESLCDGCGQCCLIKLEDEDTGQIVLTRAACKLLDCHSCRCTDYKNRYRKVPDCLTLTPEAIPSLSWLPQTCAYRLIHEGKELYDWHPLLTDDPDAIHKAGVSVQGIAQSENEITEEKLQDHIIKFVIEEDDEECEENTK